MTYPRLAWGVGVFGVSLALVACPTTYIDYSSNKPSMLDGGLGGESGDDLSCRAVHCSEGTECIQGTCLPIDPCRLQICPEPMVCSGGACVSPAVDRDGDGFPASDDCDDRNPLVRPGATRLCETACGAGYVTCQAGGRWSACSAPESCTCTGSEQRSESCGSCGAAQRVCVDGLWGAASACVENGACAPGASEVRACGACRRQQRSCSAACSWGEYDDCEPVGDCDPSDPPETCTTSCGSTGTRSCRTDCFWDECVIGSEADAVSCRDGQDNDCDGQTDCADDGCVSAAICDCLNGQTREVPCGNCGRATQRCVEGAWSASGACQAEGVCAPGTSETRPCGSCQEAQRTCTDACSWPEWGPCYIKTPCTCTPLGPTGSSATCKENNCCGFPGFGGSSSCTSVSTGFSGECTCTWGSYVVQCSGSQCYCNTN